MAGNQDTRVAFGEPHLQWEALGTPQHHRTGTQGDRDPSPLAATSPFPVTHTWVLAGPGVRHARARAPSAALAGVRHAVSATHGPGGALGPAPATAVLVNVPKLVTILVVVAQAGGRLHGWALAGAVSDDGHARARGLAGVGVGDVVGACGFEGYGSG